MTNSIQEEIKKLISKGYTSEAIQKLLVLSEPNKQIHDAINIISAEFSELTSQKIKGIIDNDEATRKLSSINDRILIALDAFDSEGNPLRSATISEGKTTKFLLKLSLIMIGFGLFIVFVISKYGREQIGYELFELLDVVSLIMTIIGFIILGGWLIALIARAIRGK